jgi:hypothetical protein
MAKRYGYNVLGYLDGSRIMKETITAENRAQAKDIGREILRARGFSLKKVRIEVVSLDPSFLKMLGL